MPWTMLLVTPMMEFGRGQRDLFGNSTTNVIPLREFLVARQLLGDLALQKSLAAIHIPISFGPVLG
jgi:hypothetical protein